MVLNILTPESLLAGQGSQPGAHEGLSQSPGFSSKNNSKLPPIRTFRHNTEQTQAQLTLGGRIFGLENVPGVFANPLDSVKARLIGFGTYELHAQFSAESPGDPAFLAHHLIAGNDEMKSSRYVVMDHEQPGSPV
jgi:hypothetical protein